MIKPRGAAGVFRPEKLARRSKIPKRIRCKTGGRSAERCTLATHAASLGPLADTGEYRTKSAVFVPFHAPPYGPRHVRYRTP